MTIRNPQPTMRREFGHRLSKLSLAKKNFGHAIAMQTSRRLPSNYRAAGEAVEEERAQAEGATLTARQSPSALHGGETRWRARSTLLLLVSVATLFGARCSGFYSAESSNRSSRIVWRQGNGGHRPLFALSQWCQICKISLQSTRPGASETCLTHCFKRRQSWHGTC
jgi:hypothetical protein